MKVSNEEDNFEVTTLSYKQLFKLSAKLIEEHDKIEKSNLDPKDYIEFLEHINETIWYEMPILRNQTNKCETCVSMKKELKDLHKTLSKFIIGK